jgi:head-tail adaptor
MSEVLRPHRHRITIQQRIESRNIVGEVVHDWELLFNTWAMVGDGWLTIRYHPSVEAGQRVIVDDGRILDIKRIADIPAKHRLLKLYSNASEITLRATAGKSLPRFRELHWLKSGDEEKLP